MKKNSSIKGFVLGFIFAVIICAFCIPALAALADKTITVQQGVTVYLDDQPLDMKDANGNTVEAFVYNGTTYLPARAAANAVGKSIVYDPDTAGIYIGTHKEASINIGTTSTGSNLIGNWTTNLDGTDISITFKSDGTVITSDSTEVNTYTTTGNTLIITIGGDEVTLEFKIYTSGGKEKLDLTIDNETITLTKN